jgi:hypothetical protein
MNQVVQTEQTDLFNAFDQFDAFYQVEGKVSGSDYRHPPPRAA